MTGAGRPLRFLALLVCGWVGARVILLMPPAAVVVDTLRDATTPPVVAAAILPLAPTPSSRVTIRLPARSHRLAVALRDALACAVRTAPVAVSGVASSAVEPSSALPSPPRLFASQTVALQAHPIAPDRWSASAWLIARDRGATTLAPAGSLGGSQTGARIVYRPDIADGRLALFVRASRPLETRGAEAALGIEAQPVADVPIRVALEQRVALERGAAEGTTLSVIGGASDVRLPHALRLDAYGQAGIVGLKRRAGFVDGALTVVRPIAENGPARVALGAGVWGAAQPGVARLDIGPRLETIVPVGSRRVRLGFEYRKRIAGNARPNSGLALVAGTDL